MRRLNRRFVGVLAVVLVLFVGAPVAWLLIRMPGRRNVAPLMAKAAERAQAGDVDEAILRYRRVLQLDPRCDAAHFAIGELLERRGPLGAGAEQYRRAIEANPRNKQALERLGRIGEEAGSFELLRWTADRLLVLDPKHADGHYWLALCLANAKDYERAAGEAKQAVEAAPDSTKAIALLGDLHCSLKRYALAESILQGALGKHPDEVGLLLRLGRLYETREDEARSAEKAQAAYERAVKATPDAPAPRLALARFFVEQKRPGEAEKQFALAAQRNPKEAGVVLAYVDFLIGQGRSDEGEKQLVAAGARDPKDKAIALAYADFLMSRGRPEDARKDLEGMLASMGDWPEARARLVEVLIDLGKSEEATVQFGQLPTRSPNAPPAVRGRYALLEGRLLDLQGYLPAAAAKLREAIHLTPSFARAQVHFYLGLVYGKQGEIGSARASFEEAARLAANSPAVQYQLARASLAVGQHDVAIEAARKALTLAPGDQAMQRILVQALAAKGDIAAAAAELDASAKASKDKGSLSLERAALHLAARKYDEAERTVLALPAEARSSGRARLLLAEIYLASGQLPKAEKELEDACKAAPGDIAPRELLASVYAGRGQIARIQVLLEDFAEAQPKNVRAQLALARFYHRIGHLEDALRFCRRAEALDPASLAVAGETVAVLVRMKRSEDALAAAKRIAAAKPGRLDALLVVPGVLLDLEKWAEAIPLLEEAVKEHPNEAQPAYLLARAYFGKGDPLRASALLRNVLSLRPDWTEAALLLAEACFRSGNYTEAISWSERVAARRPDLRFAHVIAALSHAGSADYARAIQEYLDAQPDQPRAGYYLQLAEFYQRDGQPDRAEQALRKAQGVDPKSPAVAFALASHYDAVGKPAEAEDVIRRLQAEEPTNPLHMVLWARHYRSLGRLDEAEKACRRSIDLGKESAESYLGLGDFLLATERPAEAAEAYRKALGRGSSGARAKLAAALAQSGRLAEARQEVDAGLKADPSDPSLHVERAHLLMIEAPRGDFRAKLDEARATCEKAIKLSPATAEAHVLLAESHLADRPPHELAAVAALQEAIRRAPDHVPARLRLALLQVGMGNLADAERECRRVLTLAPDSLAALGTLATARARNDPRQSRRAVAEALAKEFPKHPGRHVILGHALAQERNWEAAGAAFRACLQERPASAEAQEGLVRVLMASGRRAEAVAECQGFLKRSPASVRALELSGSAHLANQEPAKAAEAFEAAARLDPAEVRLVAAAAEAHQAAGQPERAVACCRAYVASWPRDARGHIVLGSALVAQKKLPEGEREFAKALELDGDSIEALRLLAGARVKQQRPEEAIAACRAFQRAHANSARAWQVLAEVYASQDKLPDARASLEEALVLDPKLLSARRDLGSLYLRLKAYDLAAAQFEQILAVRPDWPPALNNMAWALGAAGRDLDRAKNLAAKAAELDPASPSCLDTLGWICYKRNEHKEATAALQRSLALRPDSPTTRYHLAAALAAQGKTSEALAEVQRALAPGAGFPEADQAKALLAQLQKGGVPDRK